MTLRLRNRFRIILVPMLVAGSSICAPAQIVLGTISGTVYGPDGLPLASASVRANIVSAVPKPVDRSSTVPRLTTVSGRDGGFAFSQVPPGEYRLCARAAGVAALDPCVWGGAPLVQIASGHLNMSGEAIRMAVGVPLQMHLDDPSGFLATHEGSDPKATMIIGLATSHGFLPISVTQSSIISRDYQVLVPLNVTLNIVISTRYFKLTDQAGAPITGPIAVSFSSISPVNPIHLHVVGVN